MRDMNEEIYQTCVLLADSLEATAVFSTSQKPQVQKALEDQWWLYYATHANGPGAVHDSLVFVNNGGLLSPARILR